MQKERGAAASYTQVTDFERDARKDSRDEGVFFFLAGLHFVEYRRLGRQVSFTNRNIFFDGFKASEKRERGSGIKFVFRS